MTESVELVFGYPSQVTSETPHNHCLETVLKCIDEAKHSISIWVYMFNSFKIRNALLDAMQRNVLVQVLSFDTKDKYCRAILDYLLTNEIEVRRARADDQDSGQSHIKMMIIDENQILVTGSFNFTHAASAKNDEMVIVVRQNTTVVNKALAHFQCKWNKSTRVRKLPKKKKSGKSSKKKSDSNKSIRKKSSTS